MIYVVLLLIITVLLLAFWVYRLRVRLRDSTAEGKATLRGTDDDPGASSVISAVEAQAGAQRGFAAYGLLTRPDWGTLLSPPARALQPILVQRLDATGPADEFYYLVPFGESDQAVGAVARVDAVSGKYLEVNAFVPRGSHRTWGAMIADWRSELATRRRIAGQTFSTLDGRAAFAADARGVGVHPSFVWKPCVESMSPFYPFRLLTIGNRRHYVRIDGRDFPALTDPAPGTLNGSYD